MAGDGPAAAQMTADQKTTPAARAAETLGRQADDLAPSPGGGPRALARRALLRLLRPYSHHQRELDERLLDAMRAHEAMLERQQERIERLEELARELILTAESLRRASAEAARDASAARETIEPIAAELYAPPFIAGAPFERHRAPVGEVLGYRAGHIPGGESGGRGRGIGRGGDGEGGAGEGYAAFEDLFRGSAERVTNSQRPYLILLRDHQPVLDIGCGRGEMLELLTGEGIAVSGVDSDASMVARCRTHGLNVVQADANAHLAGVPADSLGTVFSAQVIEHLPHAELHRLLEHSLRALRPGGLFIAETVNPHRISALKTFWVDLTHQHPIFPEVALALCADAGFPAAYVFAPGFDSFERARFDSPAYTVVATAPGEA